MSSRCCENDDAVVWSASRHRAALTHLCTSSTLHISHSLQHRVQVSTIILSSPSNTIPPLAAPLIKISASGNYSTGETPTIDDCGHSALLLARTTHQSHRMS
jgi:hypothetical protein